MYFYHCTSKASTLLVNAALPQSITTPGIKQTPSLAFHDNSRSILTPQMRSLTDATSPALFLIGLLWLLLSLLNVHE
jgi:hypothetical protein